jgi:hypothetical protein
MEAEPLPVEDGPNPFLWKTGHTSYCWRDTDAAHSNTLLYYTLIYAHNLLGLAQMFLSAWQGIRLQKKMDGSKTDNFIAPPGNATKMEISLV